MSQEHKGIPVFRPTIEEVRNGFGNYITAIEPLCVNYGLAKIIPPKEWNPREDGWFEEAVKNLSIPTPISQSITQTGGTPGIFQQTNIVKKRQSVVDFRKRAEKALAGRGYANSDNEIERKFWKSIRFDPPIYGADMNGTLFTPQMKEWNVAHLGKKTLLKYLGTEIDGVNIPYLYFGMWKAMFSWHTEDMDLFSINYLHYGDPKRWYVIPESERGRFEQLTQSHFPELHTACKQFLRHKTTMISPTIVKNNGISVYTGVQRENEIMITLPGAYHMGFNYGFNCAESVNFAVESWIPRGLKATVCNCKTDSVSINMEVFLNNYKTFGQKKEKDLNPFHFPLPSFTFEELVHYTPSGPYPLSLPTATTNTSPIHDPSYTNKPKSSSKKPGGAKKKKKRKKLTSNPTPSKKQCTINPSSTTGLNYLPSFNYSNLSSGEFPITCLPPSLISSYSSIVK